MKYKLLLVGFIAAMAAGCSSAYKASQTPDDVYYSPARAGASQRNVAKEDRYEDYLSSQDDQYLRMKVRDRQRWSTIDDYAYWNDTRYVPSFSYNYYRNNWNSPYAWNNPYMFNSWNSPFYYSPMFSPGYGYNSFGGYYPMMGYGGYGGYGFGYAPYSNVYISKNPVRMRSGVSRPSLSGYSNRNYNNTNPNYNRQGLGSSIRKAFSPNENSTYSNRNLNNTNTNTFRAPERTYTPSSSGSSSGGGYSGGARSSGGVSRPPR
jgi:uncharacterized membrane protein YgcG